MDKCEVPCKPVDDKLAEIWGGIRSKASIRLVLTLFGIIFGFCVVVLGGFQWQIYEKVSNINTKISIELTAQSRDLAHLKEEIENLNHKKNR